MPPSPVLLLLDSSFNRCNPSCWPNIQQRSFLYLHMQHPHVVGDMLWAPFPYAERDWCQADAGNAVVIPQQCMRVVVGNWHMHAICCFFASLNLASLDKPRSIILLVLQLSLFRRMLWNLDDLANDRLRIYSCYPHAVSTLPPSSLSSFPWPPFAATILTDYWIMYLWCCCPVSETRLGLVLCRASLIGGFNNIPGFLSCISVSSSQ